MKNLTFIAVMACIIWSITDAENFRPCCVAVSRSMVKENITGYSLQKKNPPCVKAIILQTETKQLCIDPSQTWPYKKIKEFKNSQKSKMSPTSASPHLTFSVPPNSADSS